MAESTSPRFGLHYWGADTDSLSRDEFMSSLTQIELLGAIFGQDTLANRPNPGTKGRFFFVTDAGDNHGIWYDTGTSWEKSATIGGVAPTAEAYGSTGSEGTSTSAARADHRHAMPTHVDADHSAIHLNALAAPASDVDLNNYRILNLANPTGPADAAPKNYVDGAVTTGINSIPIDAVAGTGSMRTLGTGAQQAAAGNHTHSDLAPKASPTLTGTPTAPTAAVGTNTIQLATTAFVIGQASITTPAAEGSGVAGAVGTSTYFARADHVHGMPSIPIASSTTPLMDGAATVGTGSTWARADHVHPVDTTRAPLNSPGFQGSPTAPTPPVAANDASLATTAFAQALATSKLSTTTPQVSQINGAVGTGTTYARADHVHPLDTSSRTPSGPASGDLTGNYPGPSLGTNVVDVNEVGPGIIEAGKVVGGATGTATTTSPALRALGTASNDAASGDHTHTSFSADINMNGHTFTNLWKPGIDDNSALPATTSWVMSQAASATPLVDGAGAVGASTRWARQDHVHPTDTSRAEVADVQVFTASGTWTMPAGAQSVRVFLIGGGGGGGGGASNGSGTPVSGGGGGNGGYATDVTVPASTLTATVTVTIGSGGPGGAGTAGNGASLGDGLAGSHGGDTSFGSIVASGGAGGGGGLHAGTSTTNNAWGVNVTDPFTALCGLGGLGMVGTLGAPGTGAITGGGGGGGGYTSSGTSKSGGAGGPSIDAASVNGIGGNPGTPGHASTHYLGGGGGSGGSGRVSGNGFNGGNGGQYGGGGGGGAGIVYPSASAYTGGTGGAGAPGIAVITTYF